MANSKGGTSNIRIAKDDLKDPNLYRLNRKLDLIESQISGGVVEATQAAIKATTKRGPRGHDATIGIPPDVTATFTGIVGQLSSHNTIPVFQGRINLPVGAANYAIFYQVVVYVRYPDADAREFEIARYQKPVVDITIPQDYIDFSGSTDGVIIKPTAQDGFSLIFRVYSEEGALSANPYEIDSITVPAAAITLLTGTDLPAERYANENRSVFTVYTVGVGCSIYPETISLWEYDGVTNKLHGWYTITEAVAFEIGHQGGKEILYAPLEDETRFLKAAFGTWEGSDTDGWTDLTAGGPPVATVDSIPGVVVSAGFTVVGMQLPLATDVTSLTFDAGDGTTFPYDQVSTPDNIRYWSITGVRVDSSVAFADPNVFVYVVIVTDIGAGGTPIGVPHIWGGYLPTGGIDFLNHLDGPYGDQAVPERSGPIAAVRFEVYCCSRKNQTTLAWTDPTCSTKQTHLNGTSDHIDVTVAVGGATPASLIKGHPVLGKGLFYNVGNGNLDLGVTAASIGLVDADFENDGTGWVFGLGAHINTDPMYVQSGAKSVQITTSSADGYAWSPPFGVDKDQEIFVEIYAVAVGVTTALLRLWIAFYDGAGTYIGDGGSVSLTPTYAHPTDTGFVRVWNHGVSSDPSVAAARIILDIVPNGGADPDTGVYYVDHVSERPQTPFGPGQTRDNHGGVKVLVAGPIYNDIANAVNIRIAPDFVVSSIGGFSTLGVGFIDLVKATGFGGLNPDGSSIFAGGGGSAPFTVNKIGVNYLAVGDALFAGTATFAYFSGGVEGGKVTINSLGITIANKITSPTVTLTLAASGATIANGANNVQVTAFGMIVVVGATIPVQIDATGILLENGFSSVSITASAVTITNGVLNTPVINVVNGTVTAQINDVAVSGSPGLVVQDSSTGYTAGVGYNFISIAQLVAGVNTFAQLTPGALTAGTSTGQGATLTPSIFSMTNLRSTDPGAGSKEIWYDPADGNRLKYRP